MKLSVRKFAGIFTAAVLSTVVLVGCGGQKEAAVPTDNKEASKTYVVATRGTFRPFSYQDESGNLTGFDIEILKEIERRNPDIHFEFKLMSTSAAFMGLESNQVDIVANQITYNKQREEKAIWTKEVNNYTSRRLAVRSDNNDIDGLDTLRGKSVAVTSTSEVARQLAEYNETANPKIDLILTDKGATEVLNLVVTGRADAAPVYEVTIDDAAKNLGIDVKAVGPVIASDPTHFALRKDAESQKLADRLDVELKKLREDGTLKSLSEKFLLKDYTVPQK